MTKSNLAFVNKNMLKWAREQTPFCRQEVAESLRVSETLLSDWEDGNGLPSVKQAKEMAKKYKIPFAALYLSEIPKAKIQAYIDRRSSTTSIPEMSQKLWGKIEDFKSQREILMEITDADSLKTIDFSYLYKENISKISKEIRLWLNISSPYKTSAYKTSPFDFFRKKCEEKNILVFAMDEIPVEEVRGLSLFFDKLPIIAVNNYDSEAGKTFTLFHELGHIIRKTSSLCSIEDFFVNVGEEEAVCNKIAAEILLPKDIVLLDPSISYLLDKWEDKEIERISKRYGVSKQTLLIKLYELHLISQTFFKEKNDQYVLEFEQIREKYLEQKRKTPVKLKYSTIVLSRVGRLFPRLILEAYYSQKITYGEAIRYLGVKTKHISNIQKAVSIL